MKVELISDGEHLADAKSSSLFEKFDSKQILDTYEEFCKEKQIDDVALGLNYLSKIDINHVATDKN